MTANSNNSSVEKARQVSLPLVRARLAVSSPYAKLTSRWLETCMRYERFTSKGLHTPIPYFYCVFLKETAETSHTESDAFYFSVCCENSQYETIVN